MVDTIKNGYVTSGGVSTENEDINNIGHTQNYFYDSLVYPGAFTSALSGHDNESIFGYRTTTTGTATTRYSLAFQVILGTYHVYDQIALNIPDSGRVNFLPPVGTRVTGTETFVGTSGMGSSLGVSMTLTSIDATMPAIAIRAPAMAAPAWMDAQRKDGALFLENLSGQTAVVAVLDVSGRTRASVTLDDRAMIPASALPQGRLFLEVTRIGRGESSRQVFNF